MVESRTDTVTAGFASVVHNWGEKLHAFVANAEPMRSNNVDVFKRLRLCCSTIIDPEDTRSATL